VPSQRAAHAILGALLDRRAELLASGATSADDLAACDAEIIAANLVLKRAAAAEAAAEADRIARDFKSSKTGKI
jgi:hypothetical protein